MRSFLFFAFVPLSSFLLDIEVSNVNYKSKVDFEGKAYTLNGAGIREKFFLDIYTIGLYLNSKSFSGDSILNSRADKLLRIVVVSSFVTADKFNKGIDEGFKKSTNNNIDPIMNEIAELKKGFGDDFKVGDKFDVFFSETGETKIYKSDIISVTITANKIFQKALLAIWIGDEPVTENLKDELLGID